MGGGGGNRCSSKICCSLASCAFLAKRFAIARVRRKSATDNLCAECPPNIPRTQHKTQTCAETLFYSVFLANLKTRILKVKLQTEKFEKKKTKQSLHPFLKKKKIRKLAQNWAQKKHSGEDLGKWKWGLSKRGLGPKGSFGAISALPPWL